jgi:hypothetical protein
VFEKRFAVFMSVEVYNSFVHALLNRDKEERKKKKNCASSTAAVGSKEPGSESSTWIRITATLRFYSAHEADRKESR